MSVQDSLNAILGRLTPEYLSGVILALAKAQPADTRSSVSLPGILDAIGEGADLGTGSEGWSSQLRLKQAIREVVAQVPGMRYIEGDA